MLGWATLGDSGGAGTRPLQRKERGTRHPAWSGPPAGLLNGQCSGRLLGLISAPAIVLA
jgi:hypothetical protein